MEDKAPIESVAEKRSSAIVFAGITGIVVNLLLVALKAAVGHFTHSIAVVNDALNNLTDAGSALITIVGTKLAMKPADHRHPYGHGRGEYLTTIAIGLLVGWAGISSLVESIQSILEPAKTTYSILSLVTIAAATIVKVLLGLYLRREGTKFDADTLRASGTDSLNDALLTFSTLMAAILSLFANVHIEGWIGCLISVFILKSSWDIFKEALDEILGLRIDGNLSRDIKETIASIEGVHGVFDLFLIDFGPQRLSGAVHIEVDEDLTAHEIDFLSRTIQYRVFARHKVILHTVGIYSTNSEEASEITRAKVALADIKRAHPYVLEIHGLYFDQETKTFTFDVVVSFEAEDRQAEVDAIVKEISERMPGYTFSPVLDNDISD